MSGKGQRAQIGTFWLLQYVVEGSGIGLAKRIGFPFIAPFFKSELRSLNRSKIAGSEDRSVPERPLLTTMILDIPVVEHSQVGVVQGQVVAPLVSVCNGDRLKIHLLSRVEVAPLAQDVAQVEPELCSYREYPANGDGIRGV